MQIQQKHSQHTSLWQHHIWRPWPSEPLLKTRFLSITSPPIVSRKHWTSAKSHPNHHLMGTAPCRNRLTHPRRCYYTPHIYPMNWIPSICQFLANIQGKLMLECNFIMPLQHKHDIHVMDLTLHYTTKSTILKIINACRFFLQIKLLIDITTCDGKNTQSNAVEGIRTTTSQPTTMYPYQPNPNCKAWLSWK